MAKEVEGVGVDSQEHFSACLVSGEVRQALEEVVHHRILSATSVHSDAKVLIN